MSGKRRSISRESASAARRTSEKPKRGSTRTIDVHPARAAGLRQAAQAELLEQRLDLERYAAHVRDQATPGPGSRSTRNSFGCSRSPTSTG